MDAPPATSTRPLAGAVTSADRNQNPGSAGLPSATAVLPSDRSPEGAGGGASAAALSAADVVSKAAAVVAPDVGTGATTSGRGGGFAATVSTGGANRRFYRIKAQ